MKVKRSSDAAGADNRNQWEKQQLQRMKAQYPPKC